MSFSRRTFFAGAAAGLSMLVLTSCEPDTVRPTPTPTPVPTTTPTAVPVPANVLRSSWGADPFTRGSHSYLAVGSAPEQRSALRQVAGGRIFFAGEATSDDDPGTVSGALASGERAAGQVDAASGPSERIAVVGAGAAGAAAAAALARSGYDVTVIEAHDRIGGRIFSGQPDGWPVVVELGAGRFRSDGDPTVLARLRALGVDLGTLTEPAALVTPEGVAADDRQDGGTALTNAITWAADRPADVSLADALEGSGASNLGTGAPPSPTDYLSLELRRRITDIVGADAGELSAWYGLDSLSGPPDTIALGGVAGMIQDLLGSLPVWLSTAVLSISRTDDAVSLRLGTGESVTFDRVIVTVPLGVLKAEGIEIDPPLPFDQRTAIDEIGFGVVETIWVRFDSAFWSTDATLWSVLGSDFVITDWINLLPVTGESVLIGVVGGESAAAMSALGDGELQEAVLTALAPFVG